MWNHFGDDSTGPSGTYFYERGEEIEYFWNIFDQLLLRPELTRFFDPSSLKIVTQVGAKSLAAKNGRPDKRTGSDHFPLVFELDT
jgi:hypothetical protein